MNLAVGTGLYNIPKKDIEMIKIIIPTLEKQKGIGRFLNLNELRNDLMTAQLKELKIYKKYLLRKLFI